MRFYSVLVGIRSLVLIPLSVMVLACAAMVMMALGTGERTVNGRLAKPWARFVLWLAATRLNVEGAHRIPSLESPYVVVMNHQSSMDIPVLVLSLPIQVRFIGKIELKKIPLFGSGLLKAGHFLIDRYDHLRAIEGMRGVGQTLKQRGVSVVFAPEGTRSEDGKLLPFKKGAFVMAIETGLPVLPVTIRGTRNVLPKGSLWARKADVEVTIHEPVLTDSLTYEDREDLLVKVRGMMEKDLV